MNPLAKQIRRDILDISRTSGHGHIPTCFSVVEMMLAAYRVMRQDPQDPQDSDRDVFVLSKGHAALAQYCVLAHWGYFDKEMIFSFGGFNSRFGCHADRLKVPGAEVSAGSLGHGIGLAVGIALGIKMKKQDRKVYALIGDGESNEGTVWEAVMVAANLGLDNLVILLDFNRSQIRGLQIENPVEKFQAFGCQAMEVPGHDIGALEQALRGPVAKGRPRAIVGRTIKGYGCSTLIADMHAWHRRAPTQEEYTKLLEELNAQAIS